MWRGIIPTQKRTFCFKLFMESLNITGRTNLALDRFKPVPKILFESFQSLICDGNMPLWPKAMPPLRGEKSTRLRSRELSTQNTHGRKRFLQTEAQG